MGLKGIPGTAAWALPAMLSWAGAQTIDISGKVADAQGKPIAGASVRLMGQGLVAVSGADGGYALKGTVGIGPVAGGSKGVTSALLRAGMLRFRVEAGSAPVEITLRDPAGRLRAILASGTFPGGEYEIPLELGRASPGLSILTVSAGRERSAFLIPVASIARPDGLRIAVTGIPARAAKAAAGPDSLEVRADGFIRKVAGLPGYQAKADVALDARFQDPELAYPAYQPKPGDRAVSRSDYVRRLHGMWLGESMANWTGLVTEMDRIQAPFYTRADWGKRDQKSIWGDWGPNPDTLIDFTFTFQGRPWGADDDTDLEYMYQHLLDEADASVLTPAQIRDGWLKHIKAQEENYLWVSNQRAFDLMGRGMLPPETGLPKNNPDFDMIDAQLTTEIFGAFAPGRPDIADRLASLPIRATAYGPAETIARFYVRMYSLAAVAPAELPMKERVQWIARMARPSLPDTGYPAKMYDFVYGRYTAGNAAWETVRDDLDKRYQTNHADGYDVTSRPGIACKGCFAAGINFGASIISLFYGEGDLAKTIQIASLCGWDSDNPTATWGGLLGLLLGKDGIETAFGRRDFSETFWIHRTRQNFPDRTPGVDGEDTFPMMARRGALIIDRAVLEEMKGGVDPERDLWYIPAQ